MSIYARELRIGNWVILDGFKHEFTRYDFDHDNDHISTPIPLTTEILEKCGFVLDTKVWWYFPNNELPDFAMLDNSHVEKSFSLTIEQLVLAIPNIKYIHQLQNIFYSLTGKELNFNL